MTRIYNIAPAVLSCFFKDLNVLPAVYLRSHIDYPILPTSNLCLAFSKVMPKSYQPELQYRYQHAVAVNSLTEVLISEIEERQCLWNIFNPRDQG